MQPHTEELLNLLLWSAERLARPTFRNLTGSYESWAYRHGIYRQAVTLEKQKVLERDPQVPDERIYRLTELGRLRALGGRDPPAQWDRDWDGCWRFVLFDVPTSQNSHRTRLRRYLRGKAFGCLQNSVWISPDPLVQEREILGARKVNVESLLLLEARPCAEESDAAMVAGAWNFERINRRYAQHLKVLARRPPQSLRDNAAARALQVWAVLERQTWLAAVGIDPLLPERLLPTGYLGRDAWQRRIETLHQAGQQLQTFGG